MPILIESLRRGKETDKTSVEDLRNRARRSHFELISTYQKLRVENSELLHTTKGTNLQRSLQIIQLITTFGQLAAQYFEKGKNVSLTGVNALSLTNAHFEFGRNFTRTPEGKLKERLGLWHVHSDNAKEITPQKFTEMVENFSAPIASENLANLSPNQVFMIFSRHLDLASR